MKPLFLRALLALLASAPFYSIAQTDTAYYDEFWNKAEWNSARYYPVTTKEGAHNYKVEDHYFKNNKLQMSGHYSSLDPEVQNGDFVFYDDKGLKTSEGKYERDKQEGTWKNYYSNTDTLWYVETYKRGVCTDLTSFYKNGSIKRKETYKDGKADGICWNEKGEKVKFTPFRQLPEAPFNVTEYIKENIQYPDSLIKRNMSGKIVTRFTINEDGHISDIVVTKGVTEELDKYVMDIVRKMPNWTPAIEDDKIVKAIFNLPVSFKL